MARPTPPRERRVITHDKHHRQRLQLEGASREAEGYLELGMHDQALDSLQRRGKLVHSDGHACYLLGETLRELSRYREALYPLRRAVSLSPDETPTWLALGWCYKRTGQLRYAIESLERAVVITPSDAMLHFNLACYYSLDNRRLDALRRLKRAIDLDRSFLDLVEGESDFDPMREDPAFRMLMRSLG